MCVGGGANCVLRMVGGRRNKEIVFKRVASKVMGPINAISTLQLGKPHLFISLQSIHTKLYSVLFLDDLIQLQHPRERFTIMSDVCAKLYLAPTRLETGHETPHNAWIVFHTRSW